MTDTPKIVGQVVPSANVLTTLYTVPGSTSCVISSITICNQGVVGTSFSISLAKAGASDDPKQYIYYQLPLDTNDTFVATIGVGLATTDVVRVLATTANISFNAFGVEVS